MEIKMFDKVRLKDGRTAFIVEIYGSSGDYEADIDMPDGSVETDTINRKDIEKILC